MNITEEYVHEGDEVTLNCHIDNSEGSGERITVSWNKYVDGQMQDQFALYELVQPPYTDTGRYSGARHIATNMTSFLFQITISDVKKTDSGRYSCEIFKKEDCISYVNLNVLSDVKVIQLSEDGDVHPSGSEVSFEGAPETVDIECVVEGAYPLPDVRMYSGEEDITDQFEQNITLRRDGERSLEALTYNVKLFNKQFAMSYKHEGKELKCVSRVPHSDFEEQNRSLQVMVKEYQPELVCPEEVTFNLYQSNVNVTCVINAKPEVESAYVSYRRVMSDDAVITLLPGEFRVHYTVELLDGETKSQKRLVLFIGRIFPQHNRQHNFTASNAKGETTVSIQLNVVDTFSSAISLHAGLLSFFVLSIPVVLHL